MVGMVGSFAPACLRVRGRLDVRFSKQLLVLRRRDRHPAVAVELTGARTVTGTRPDNASEWPYLLGLLAMIKCSICSYQCDN